MTSSELIKQDIAVAEKFVGTPCSWCNKKSIMRIRMMPFTSSQYTKLDYSKMQIVSACELHVKEFKDLLLEMNLR